MGAYKNKFDKIFYIFLLFHLSIWTLVPAFTNHNLPLDTIEALAWGSNLDWGFNKHPPMSALFVEIFYQIFGSNDWSYYLLSQIFIVLTFLIVFKFSENFFNKKVYCLISVLILEGIFFYNFTTPEFNVNVCQLPFWALTTFFAWKIFKTNRIEVKDVVLLGLFSAFGFLSKYLFAILLLSIFLLFIFEIYFKKSKKFDFKYIICLEIFFLLLIPHFIWLFKNDFITVSYALKRGEINSFEIINHFFNPIIFLFKQVLLLTPILIMILSILGKYKLKINFKDKKFQFLFFINVIPIFIILLLSFFGGIKIRTMWMTPFYINIGIFLTYIFQKNIDLRKINNFRNIFLFLLILSPITYGLVSLSQDDKRTDYPGKEIANKVQLEWNKNFNDDILIVLGNEWSAGNLSYHLKTIPKWGGQIEKKKLEKMNTFICIDDVCIGN